jgi:hypothetical protein
MVPADLAAATTIFWNRRHQTLGVLPFIYSPLSGEAMTGRLDRL